jgi:serine protease inhibitor
MSGNGDEHAVSFVKHRVVVAVNEVGSETAAATAVGGSVASGQRSPAS